MTPQELNEIGQAIWGRRWQTAMANALSVGDRRVRAWLAGDRPIPEGVAVELLALRAEADGRPVDSWLIAQSPDGAREYIIHIRPPRFVAKVIGLADEGQILARGEAIANPAVGEAIAVQQWLDPKPSGEAVMALLREAQTVFEEYTLDSFCCAEGENE